MNSFDYVLYLKAKKTVDDRALNRLVLEEMAKYISSVESSKAGSSPQILELAAGAGTMLQRLVEWNLVRNVRYTMLDIQASYIEQAKAHTCAWAKECGFDVRNLSDKVYLHRREQTIEIDFVVADVHSFFADNKTSSYDLVIANAFFDLVDASSLLPQIFSSLRNGGGFYFSINFDGETIFLPEVDSTLDQQITKDYHDSMNQQKVNGRSVSGTRAGRNLFIDIRNAGGNILKAGSSDWVVFPQQGNYLAKEDFFLECILRTVEETLGDNQSYDLSSWLAKRHQQIKDKELIYIAHQLDFFGVYP